VGPIISWWCTGTVVDEVGSGHRCATAVVVGPAHMGAVGRGRAEHETERGGVSCGGVQDV
jgi:hypothetical protein